jgi:hypothetical protein
MGKVVVCFALLALQDVGERLKQCVGIEHLLGASPTRQRTKGFYASLVGIVLSLVLAFSIVQGNEGYRER